MRNKKATAVLKRGKEPLSPSPRTFLGKRLAGKRKKIVAAGLPLFGWKELEGELYGGREVGPGG